MSNNQKKPPSRKRKAATPTSNKRTSKQLMAENSQLREVVENSTSLIRSGFVAKLFDPRRNINEECGYPDEISPEEYRALYDREGLGERIVRLLPEESWVMDPEVFEDETPDKTEFETAWDTLVKEKNVFHHLQRVDEISGIGRFGILLLGINDGLELHQPVVAISETGEKVGTTKHELLFLRPFDEFAVDVDTRVSDVKNPRFGQVEMYTVRFEDRDTKTTSTITKQIHWSRVIHIADNRKLSEVYGTPRMQVPFNRILDVRKILSGSGEMFWKGAFPGYAFESNPDIGGDAVIDSESIRQQVADYSNGLQRYLAMAGLTVKSLAPQVADPSNHIQSQLQLVAITLGVPLRILMGSEQAKLASSQDVTTWNKRLASRQTKYLDPMVIRPFVDRLIILGILPEVEEYFITWRDLNTPTDEGKAETARKQAEAMSKYVAGGVDALIPSREFLSIIMGLTDKQIDAIEEAMLEGFKEEEGVNEPPLPPPPPPVDDDGEED